MLIPVLLSGGVGSRLWPLSRELNPKQFLPLVGEQSLLVDTALRTQAVAGCSAPIVVCNEEHRFMVAEQLRQQEVNPQAIILEPFGRNTAPAVAVAALQAIRIDPEAVILVLPADHVIKDSAAFADAVAVGLSKAKQGKLVTFGIIPEGPETGYGYIRRESSGQDGCFAIAEFVEKPSLEVATGYVKSGDYLWNSGMFLLAAQAFLDELTQYAPEIMAAVEQSVEQASADLDFIRLDKAAFEKCPSDSIDYAVMEKTRNGMVVPLACGWSDVGSWSSLWEVGEKDADGNVTHGDVINHESRDSYIYSGSRLVATLGVSDIVVVETADAVMVADKGNVQNIKAIVSTLKNASRDEYQSHKKVYRPWGSYESLVSADRFQVKRIIVKPGAKLSLQMHHHRAEHWIVVSGTALVTCGDKEYVLSEDQSTYIPLGTRHRLANTGVIPLELIEVQSGSYLGEDDIVRFEDVYGRSN